MGDLAPVLNHKRHAIMSLDMTAQPDIVARLREYTRHNKPVLASDLKEAADDLEHLRKTFESFVRGVSLAAGLEPSEDDVSMEGLGRITHRVMSIRDGRDHARAEWTRLDAESRATEGHRPGALVPPATTERFDEIDRRLALLESRVRLTERRLAVTAAVMDEAGDRYAIRCSFAAGVATMIHKSLTTDEQDLPKSVDHV